MFIFQFSHDQPIHRCSLHNRLKATEEEASIFWQDLARLVEQSTGVCTNVRETGLHRPDDTHLTATRLCFERWATDCLLYTEILHFYLHKCDVLPKIKFFPKPPLPIHHRHFRHLMVQFYQFWFWYKFHF